MKSILTTPLLYSAYRISEYRVIEKGNRHACFFLGIVTYAVCIGRVHEDSCSVRKDPKRDCCLSRHKALDAQGKAFGIVDQSIAMYDTSNPSWWEPLA